MSCNITAGIAKGCNDQIGGINGIHYVHHYPGLVVEKDANGVVVRVYQENIPNVNFLWYFIEASNSQGNLTETYNINSNGSILGFHQSLNFFIPTTAEPSQMMPTQTLSNWVKTIAPHNNMIIGIETEPHMAGAGPRPKNFVFGLERPAYTNSGSKETGIQYGDNNGYTIEIAADSKEPMLEIDYMTMHLNNMNIKVGDGSNLPQNRLTSCWPAGTPQPGSTTTWNWSPIVKFLGGNVLQLIPGVLVPTLRYFEGELITFKAEVTATWAQGAFVNGVFAAECISLFNDGSNPDYVTATITNAPASYTGTSHTITVEYTYTATSDGFWTPLRFAVNDGPCVSGQGPSTIITEGVPNAKILTIAQTT